MESVIGLVGDGFVIVAADRTAARSIQKLNLEDEKIVPIDKRKLLACAGPVADRHQFADYIEKNLTLRRYRTGVELSNHAAANYIRNELATALRRAPYQVNLLMLGYDEAGAALYYLDYLGSMHKMDFAAHGYCAYFLLGILDKYYQKDLNLEQAIKLLEKCFEELKTRFIISTATWSVKVIDKDGTRTLPHISVGQGEESSVMES